MLQLTPADSKYTSLSAMDWNNQSERKEKQHSHSIIVYIFRCRSLSNHLDGDRAIIKVPVLPGGNGERLRETVDVCHRWFWGEEEFRIAGDCC